MSDELPAGLGIVSPQRFAMGGMAELYRAERTLPQGGCVQLVVKHMLPQFIDDPDLVSRFRDEARLGLLLRHSNIVRVLEYREIAGEHYMVMELVEGTNLNKLIKACRYHDRPMPQPVAAYFLLGIASALAYMADAKAEDGSPLDLVHRDISPSNVLVSPEAVIKLIDFGVAKASTREMKTKKGVVVGKYSYMSPEQIRGQPLDVRSDLFAVGAVGYELLTGRRAFLAETEFDTYNLIIGGDYPPIKTFLPGADPILEFAIKRCLEVDLDERYGHPLRLVEDLRLYLHEASEVPPPILAMQFLDSIEVDLPSDNIDEVTIEGLTTPSARSQEYAEQIGPEAELELPDEPEQPISQPSGPSLPSSPSLHRARASTEGILHGTPVAARTVEMTPRGSPWLGRVAMITALAMAVMLLLIVCTWAVGTVVIRNLRSRPDRSAEPVAVEVAAGVPSGQTGPDAGIVIEDEPEDGQAAGAGDGTVDAGGSPGDQPEEATREPAVPEPATPEPATPEPAALQTPTGVPDHPEPVAAAAARPGTVSVYCMPWGILAVDGREVGQTPVLSLELRPGRHTLKVTNPDSGLSVSSAVEVAAEQHQDVRLRIAPL